MNQLRNAGFTFIELILVIAIFAIIVGATSVSLSGFISQSNLNGFGQQTVHLLRKAQSNATMRIKDEQWGVYFNDSAGSMTFFKGGSYAGRDLNYDEVLQLPASMSLSNIGFNGGGNEVVFSKVRGTTNNYGSFDLNNNSNSTSYTITVNSFGQIAVE